MQIEAAQTTNGKKKKKNTKKEKKSKTPNNKKVRETFLQIYGEKMWDGTQIKKIISKP